METKSLDLNATLHHSTAPKLPRRRQAGIVLAAGASSRMGRPKALLETPSGQPLALVQCGLLESAGCDRVVIVLGSVAEKIEGQLTGCEIVVNEVWTKGRVRSVQTGLSALPDYDGYVILPVDTVDVQPSTLKILLEERGPSTYAVRPTYRGEVGRVLWLSDAATRDVLSVYDPAARLDDIVAGRELRIEVDDPAILNNVNTPDDWANWMKKLGAQK